MVTYTTNLRFSKPAAQDQDWDVPANTNYDLLDSAVAGYTSVDVTSAGVVLSVNNGAADQSRQPMLKIIGSPDAARTVTVPDKPKLWFVHNDTSQTVTIAVSGGGGSSAVSAGEKAIMYTYGDGTLVRIV